MSREATRYARVVADEPQPLLRRLLEDVAAVMELDEGETRLELCFADGHLTRWYRHTRGNVKVLQVFDDPRGAPDRGVQAALN